MTVEGIINAFPFRAVLEPEPDDPKKLRLKINRALQAAAGAEVGDTVTVEITRVEEEPETRMPADLSHALARPAHAQAKTQWANITPLARRDWILWITTAKQTETRAIRIEKACSMLASGKRRVCCFGGLNWLIKDHPTAETWHPLPTAKKHGVQLQQSFDRPTRLQHAFGKSVG